MTFTLRRATSTDADASDEALELAVQHAAIAAPRRGEIAWGDFDRAPYPAAVLAAAAEAWRERARQEYHSMALFTQLASQVHLLGAPLDWSGAFARMIADEVRHTEICARFSEALDPAARAVIAPSELHLPIVAPSLRAHVRGTVVAAFCIGETLSGRMFRRCLRAATVPLARDVVRTIVDDETFHGQLGWELAALLMRDNEGLGAERDALAQSLPRLFAHYRTLCGADRGWEWASEGPEADGDPNFGTLTRRGYARAFYTGMREDVIPGLVAIGLPEAQAAWDAIA
jgi:hypothetical protein